ncbi:MAG: ADP-ribosyltransferase, partial [Ruminococcus sp.]|nr:ADP-ribosyltransferase [Ruminococcus sp.]
KVTNKVTDEERQELLSQNKVDIHNSAVDKSSKSDIIEEKSRKLSLNDLEDFEKWQNNYYNANSGVSFTRQDNPNIFEYTGGSYEAVNGVLRGGEMLEKVKRRYGTAFDQSKYERISEGISSELSKFKLNETLKLRRSVSNVDFITGSTSSVEDMQKAIGKTFVEKGFTSATVCSDTMLPFGYGSSNRTTLEIVADPRYTKGAYIYKISEHPAEFEFLIDKNTAYKVIDAGEREIEVKDFRGNIRKEKERYMRLQVVKND